MVRLALDVVEDDRAAAVHQLLQAGDLEVGIDLLVRLDQIATRFEPSERATQVAGGVSVSPVAERWQSWTLTSIVMSLSSSQAVFARIS